MKLSKNSKDLMVFFTKNNHIYNVKFTKRTENIIIELYNDIYQAYEYLNTLKQNDHYFNVSSKKILNVADISKPQNFNANSFPDIIRDHISENSMY